MTVPEWAQDDDKLLALIRDADTSDDTAIDDRFRQAAKAAYTWRTVDQDLERLTMYSDAVLEDAVRTPRRSRVAEFRGRNLRLELEIGEEVVIGQIYPTQAGLVTFMTAKGLSVEARTDEVGCFMVERPANGPFRVRCDTPDSVVVTDWMT
jgi:hypothetical protein